ncbi:hypothetical protein [Spirobacillus cienkowskii]
MMIKRIFIFICFSRYALAQQNSIPVIIQPEAQQDSNLSQLERDFNSSVETLLNPSAGNINQEVIDSKNLSGSSAAPRSIEDFLSQTRAAQVERYGGEAGVLRVRLRGARAFEPTLYFKGLSLSSLAGSNISLLPLGALGSLYVYPDVAPFWLGSMGISGDINILPCRFYNCVSLKPEQGKNYFKIVNKIGSYSFLQLNASYYLKLNKETEINTTIESISSKEDYPVFNNNNSVLYADQGNYEPLKNNDFKKFGYSLGISTYNQKFGKIDFDLIAGTRSSGIPALPGSVSYARLNNNLVLAVLNNEKIFPDSGVQWSNQIGLSYSYSKNQNVTAGFSGQAGSVLSYSAQLKSWFIIPSNIISEEYSGLAFEVLHTQQQTKTFVPAGQSSSFDSFANANRTDFKPALFNSIVFPINNNFVLSSSLNSWISISNANSKMDCNYPSIQNICQNNFIQQEEPVYGGNFSIQLGYNKLISFLRISQSMRRPHLHEFYGAPNGILPNVQLLPEKSQKFETGVRLPVGEIGYFYAKDHNLIFLQQNNSNTSQFQNIENSLRYGYYLNSDFYFSDYVRSSFSYNFLNAKILNNINIGDTTLPRSPIHSASYGLNYDNIYAGNFFNFNTKFGGYFNFNWQSEFYLDNENYTSMKVPVVYNSGILFSFENITRGINFKILFDLFNIFNENFSVVTDKTGFSQIYQSNGVLGYPSPGRRIYLSIISEF